MGKRELIALLNLSSWCLVMVERLFLAVSWGCLQFVIVVFPDHTHLLFSKTFFQEHYQSVKRFGSRSGPGLGSNCLQWLSADDKSRRWQGKS